MTDTSLYVNSDLILKIKTSTLDAAFLEAYLESAPQLIFQCYTILQTGYTGNIEFLLNYANLGTNPGYFPSKVASLYFRPPIQESTRFPSKEET